MNAGQSLQACGLLIDPARLPLASSSLRSAAPAFLLFDRPGNSVPPKEPPSLRCEMPPPKHLATVVSEPDPDCSFTLLLLSFEALAMIVPVPLFNWTASNPFQFSQENAGISIWRTPWKKWIEP